MPKPISGLSSSIVRTKKWVHVLVMVTEGQNCYQQYRYRCKIYNFFNIFTSRNLQIVCNSLTLGFLSDIHGIFRIKLVQKGNFGVHIENQHLRQYILNLVTQLIAYWIIIQCYLKWHYWYLFYLLVLLNLSGLPFVKHDKGITKGGFGVSSWEKKQKPWARVLLLD